MGVYETETEETHESALKVNRETIAEWATQQLTSEQYLKIAQDCFARLQAGFRGQFAQEALGEYQAQRRDFYRTTTRMALTTVVAYFQAIARERLH